MAIDVDPELRRYAELIERSLRAALTVIEPARPDEPSTLVERGLIYPIVLSSSDRAIELPRIPADSPTTSPDVVDRYGHRRPVYRGLLFYSLFRAMKLAGVGTEVVQKWARLLESQFATSRWPIHPPDRIPANCGASIVDAAWMTLAAHAAIDAGTEVSTATRAEAFGRLAACQQADGAFLAATASDNPETHGYHELLLLHAATTCAIDTADERLATAVSRNARFYQDQMQPDHATSQPWALAAFVWNPATRPLADQILHAAATIAPASGVTSILLADALYCLHRLIRPNLP
jgi:hypothetical protein